jgi:hypothetical protein
MGNTGIVQVPFWTLFFRVAEDFNEKTANDLIFTVWMREEYKAAGFELKMKQVPFSQMEFLKGWWVPLSKPALFTTKFSERKLTTDLAWTVLPSRILKIGKDYSSVVPHLPLWYAKRIAAVLQGYRMYQHTPGLRCLFPAYQPYLTNRPIDPINQVRSTVETPLVYSEEAYFTMIFERYSITQVEFKDFERRLREIMSVSLFFSFPNSVTDALRHDYM